MLKKIEKELTRFKKMAFYSSKAHEFDLSELITEKRKA